MTHRRTVCLDEAATGRWDVLVIGAGPAGALAALELARTKLRVLLVDRKRFPRSKVCGGCLNQQALAILSRAGLMDRLHDQGAVAIDDFQLSAFGHTARLPLPEGRAISRTRLDAMLVDAATTAGAEFLDETKATLNVPTDSGRRVLLMESGETRVTIAKVVLVASGLNHADLIADDVRMRTASRSRIGAGCAIEPVSAEYRRGTIFMAVGKGGYVGLVRVEDGSLNVAAAFDRAFLRAQGSPAAAAGAILSDSALPPLPELGRAAWLGTASLTRRISPLAAERVFLLGDATGYVEPFTGEGMAWAFTSAKAVVPLVQQAVRGWDDRLVRQWTRRHRELIGRRQWMCHLLRRALRHPWLVRGMLTVLANRPALARPVVAQLNAPSRFWEVRPS